MLGQATSASSAPGGKGRARSRWQRICCCCLCDHPYRGFRVHAQLDREWDRAHDQILSIIYIGWVSSCFNR